MCQKFIQELFVLFNVIFTVSSGQLLTIKEHRTPGATQRINDLWCYQCDVMEDGERCVDLAGNHSSFMKKCENEKRICMVKRFSHTMSTENSTSVLRMWSLERNCTKHCEPGCIVIGERTKLYACTSCCETSFCNTGKGAAGSFYQNSILKMLSVLFAKLIILGQILNFSILISN